MSTIRRIMSSQGRSGDIAGLTRINFNFIDNQGEEVDGITITLSFSNDNDQCVLKDSRSIAVENGSDITIKYSTVLGYDVPNIPSSSFYLDGVTKNITVIYPKLTGIHNGYEYVDLGGTVYWATCNIGASKPEEFGNYYCWGSNNKYPDDKSYCEEELNNENLPIEYDTARKLMGGNWRMPTKSEFEELINNCSFSKTVRNGVNGIILISKINSQEIFYPFAEVYDNRYNVYDKIRSWSSSTGKWFDSYGTWLNNPYSLIYSDNNNVLSIWGVNGLEWGPYTAQTIRAVFTK